MEAKPQKIIYLKYRRKSSESDDQQALSLESQDAELNKIIQREHLEVIDLPSESKSAKAPYDRDTFEMGIKMIEQGKANAFLVWHPDRLSRNSVDTGRLIYLFDIGKLQEIKTATQVFRNTPNDKFLFQILCGAAKLENDNKAVNVKRGLTTKAESGWYPAPAPVGYLNDRPNAKGKREIKVDPERFPLVRKMFDLMLEGAHTPPEIRKIANEQWGFRMRNGKPLGRSTIYRIFTDSFYYGEYEYPKGSGKWYRGKHKPMITVEEYDRLQILLGRKGRPRPQKHAFTFSGFTFCGECGGAVTADKKVQVICTNCKFKFSAKHLKTCPCCQTAIEEMKNPKILIYVYYRCTRNKDPNCTQPAVREDEMQKQMVEILQRIEIPPEFHDWALKWLRIKNKEEAAGRDKILASARKRYTDCVKKIDGLIEMRAGGEIDQEQFAKKQRTLMKEKARLQELLNNIDNGVDKWMEAAEKVFDFARDAKKAFETGDMETKRKILAALGSNLTLRDKVLTVKLEKPLLLMEKVSSPVREISARFEPEILRREAHQIYAKNPIILPG